ncbi:MAG: MmgE/PrpD family protein [Acetobacteraceae bacterium]
MAEAGPSLARRLVRRVLADGGPPDAIRDQVALCLLDHIANCLAVRGLPIADAILRYASRSSGAAEAHHWWLGRRIPAPDAAFGNAALGHLLIRDDMHVPSGSHIGVVVIPAMLALAQRESLSGKDLLRGVVAGYEIMARTGMAVRSGRFNPHFRPTGLSGALGVAAGCATALRLDETTAVHALGFGANLSAGLNEWTRTGAQEVYIHAGSAARNGLIAVDMARAGLAASETILEGIDGMFAAYGSGPEAGDILTDGLGTAPPAIAQVEFKPFAGCNYILTPVAVAQALHGVPPNEIEAVTIRTFTAARAYPGCDCAGPFASATQAKMSIQFGVAAALQLGTVDEAAYARFADPMIVDLAQRCRLQIVPDFDMAYPARQPAEITLHRRDGTECHAGLPDVPWLGADAVRCRFRDEARHHYGSGTVRQIEALAFSLSDAPDCRALFELLETVNGRPGDA